MPAGGQALELNSRSQDERPPCGNGIAVPGDASSLPKGKEMAAAQASG